jgi:phosphatidylserine/phosphatidylglycerophosphate/cardiolipin synthase-like enzyme
VGHERVAVYDLQNVNGDAIYVHSKVCVVDDVWMAVGSDNLNRRSWTHDSELSCSVIDSRLDERAPTDPASIGDGARVLARDTRLRLATEHLGRDPGDVDDLIDPASWFEALKRGADALDAWHRNGEQGPRPAGHLREHPYERVRGARRLGLGVVHAVFLDPDGRPRAMHRRDEF